VECGHATLIGKPRLRVPRRIRGSGSAPSIEPVSALPARYRDALHLFYFHALDLKAAAASLGLPEGTLKARLARGRKLLEPLLGLVTEP